MKMLIGAGALALLLFGATGHNSHPAPTPAAPAAHAEQATARVEQAAPSTEFAPFYVIGPVAGMGAFHSVQYATDPASGRAACLDEAGYYKGTPYDCQVQPESMAPDLTKPGWLAEFARQGAA